MRIITVVTIAAFVLLSGRVALAQETDSQLLDGMEIEYTYTDGGRVIVNFYEGKLKYRWIAGPFDGTAVSDRVYKSRKIGDELYLVNWHDTENHNFVTLVINLQQNVLHSSAIIGYGSEQEVPLFDGAIIERVKR